MKEIPTGLGHYEFKNELTSDDKITRTWHLQNLFAEGTRKPVLTENNEPETKEFEFSQFFENDNPVEIEVGSGKGGFLIDYSVANPELNVVGSEWEAKWARYAGDRLHRREIKNGAMVRGDVYYFVRDYVKEATVQAFHMYFPDPWPKERHQKRRLLGEEFLKEVQRVLIPGPEAYFYWGTDHKEYNDYAMELFESLLFVEFVQKNDAEPTRGIRTNFENKYIVEGRPIYRSVLRIKH